MHVSFPATRQMKVHQYVTKTSSHLVKENACSTTISVSPASPSTDSMGQGQRTYSLLVCTGERACMSLAPTLTPRHTSKSQPQRIKFSKIMTLQRSNTA